MKSDLVILLLFASLFVMLIVEMNRSKKARIQTRKEKIRRNMDSLNKQIEDNEAGYNEALAKHNETLSKLNDNGIVDYDDPLPPIKFVAGEKLESGDVVYVGANGKLYRIKPHTLD